MFFYVKSSLSFNLHPPLAMFPLLKLYQYPGSLHMFVFGKEVLNDNAIQDQLLLVLAVPGSGGICRLSKLNGYYVIHTPKLQNKMPLLIKTLIERIGIGTSKTSSCTIMKRMGIDTSKWSSSVKNKVDQFRVFIIRTKSVICQLFTTNSFKGFNVITVSKVKDFLWCLFTCYINGNVHPKLLSFF